MPRHKIPPGLQEAACQAVSRLLLSGCQTLDRRWEEPPTTSPPCSPVRGVPLSPTREEAALALSPDARRVLDWVGHLPDQVVERVVACLLELVETQLLEDKDRKLIMTLINIEQMRVNDFFFGVHSLLALVQGCRLQQLHFSKRLWFCLWEYGEITGSKRMTDTLCSSLPGLSCLTNLNLAYVANDRILYVVSRYLTNLLMLDISNSRVTDRGLRFLAGQNCVTFVRNSSVARNLSLLLDAGEQGRADQRGRSDQQRMAGQQGKGGCSKLERLNLQACDGVTEGGVRLILENLRELRRIEYHQVCSVLEILVKWSSTLTEQERKDKVLSLTEVEHGFPYGLFPPSEQVLHLVQLCPRLTTITLVTDDRTVALLTHFPHLTSLTVELEDCLGEGFLSFLSTNGPALLHLSLSCSSDPDSTLLAPDQPAQQGHLFNLSLLAVGLLAPRLTKLSVSGCGLVTSAALQQLQLVDRLGSAPWLRRQTWFNQLTSLLLMSYEESQPGATVNPGLMRAVLSSAYRLEVLNLEGNFGSFNDQFMREVVGRAGLGDGPLSHLRVLDISVCDQGGVPGRLPLTVLTARDLLTRCPDLRELRVSDWDIRDGEFNELERMVASNNWDLSLTRKLASQ